MELKGYNLILKAVMLNASFTWSVFINIIGTVWWISQKQDEMRMTKSTYSDEICVRDIREISRYTIRYDNRGESKRFSKLEEPIKFL